MLEEQKGDDGQVRYDEGTNKEVRCLGIRFETLAAMKAWFLFIFLRLTHSPRK